MKEGSIGQGDDALRAKHLSGDRVREFVPTL